MKIVPVILSGGSGTRLWPLSRKQYPKQYLPLVNDLVEEFGYKPSMSFKQGVENFAVWYKEYNE